MVRDGVLKVTYQKPTPIDLLLTRTGRIEKVNGHKSTVVRSLLSGGEARAGGEMLAMCVPLEWFEPRIHAAS